MKPIKLCDRLNCTACAACINSCSNGAITMGKDEQGFDYPVIDGELCVKCGLCQSSCPILVSHHDVRSASPDVYVAWSLDSAVRTTSSSGGIFAELASETIERGGVVFGAAFDENFHLAHQAVQTTEELEKLKGAKYLQSEIGYTFRKVRQLLRLGRQVLFVGTPCQVAGLRSYLRVDYEQLTTCDIICHGVPSPELFEKYRRRLMASYGVSKMDGFAFRDVSGWRLEFSFTTDGVRQPITLDSVNVLYPRAFLKDFMHRESCYRCAFACTPRQGDITIADFWGVGDVQPFVVDDDLKRGVSLVLVNSKHGADAFRRIDHRIFCEQRELSEAVVKNQNLVAPTRRPLGRDSFYSDFDAMDFEQLMDAYSLRPKSSSYR